jgi:catechol 2,3-dioxygenase-like lactoylglutathione lyase family enzyme
MTGPTLQRTVPILRIFDVAKAKEFYVDWLGFTVDWEHGAEEGLPLYPQVSLGDIVLHLSEHYGDGSPGSAVRFEITGLQALHEAISAKNYRYMRPGLDAMPWGWNCVQLLDPFGNRLNFEEKIAG